MHRSGVRHQDIKPENIFLARFHEDEDGEILPVLLDLGVAAKDAENVLAGTPNYFAPEIAARFAREPDPPHITNKADVFSLALALRNALSPSAEEASRVAPSTRSSNTARASRPSLPKERTSPTSRHILSAGLTSLQMRVLMRRSWPASSRF